jgi:nucleosome binding factor SPN SPT16 subunit
MPTVHCLVNLSEQPFFVLTLKEVEVCHFERISYSLRNFDLCFIYKNYTQPVLRISAIPVSHKETIMNWLDEMNIIFSCGPNNFNWKNMMKIINKDVKKFIDDGTWG